MRGGPAHTDLQRMFMPAISSMAERRWTMACSRLSSRAPTARAVVTTRGIATGSTATSTTIASFSAPGHSCPSRNSSTKKIGMQLKFGFRGRVLGVSRGSRCTRGAASARPHLRSCRMRRCRDPSLPEEADEAHDLRDGPEELLHVALVLRG